MPLLSVRTLHAVGPVKVVGIASKITIGFDQEAPPSVDRATTMGELTAPKEVQHAYTLPKKRLLAALSAQIASLSLKVSGVSCLEAMTGIIQAFLSPRAAARTSSVRATAMPSCALIVVVPGKLDVRLA